MALSSIGLSLNWNPWSTQSSAKNVFADLLNLGGVSAAALRFSRAQPQYSRSASGNIYEKTVVDEVTRVTITANTSYGSPWLAGSIEESTNSTTTIPGVNAITIDRQSTAEAEFGSDPASALVESSLTSAMQIHFAGDVSNRDGDTEREQISLDTSAASGDVVFASGGKSLVHTWQNNSVPSVDVTSTPVLAASSGSDTP